MAYMDPMGDSSWFSVRNMICTSMFSTSMYSNFVENRFSGGRPIYTYGMVQLQGAYTGTSWFCVHRFARGAAQQILTFTGKPLKRKSYCPTSPEIMKVRKSSDMCNEKPFLGRRHHLQTQQHLHQKRFSNSQQLT